MGAAQRIYEMAEDLPPGDPLRQVIELGDGDPLLRLARIEEGLRTGRLPLMLPRQESGFWIAPHENIDAQPPSWSPPGALLPRIGEKLEAGAIVLDLVPIDYVWFPLSEAGAYTYAHSAGLLRGEIWRFVRQPSAGCPWPTVLAVTLAQTIAPHEVASWYGREASLRTRADYPAVQLHVTPARP